MRNSISKKEFSLDTFLTSRLVIKKLGIDSLKLKLQENLTYSLINKQGSFIEYEGRWDFSHYVEISYFIFELNNGEVQKTRSLCLNIKGMNIYFTDAKQ